MSNVWPNRAIACKRASDQRQRHLTAVIAPTVPDEPIGARALDFRSGDRNLGVVEQVQQERRASRASARPLPDGRARSGVVDRAFPRAGGSEPSKSRGSGCPDIGADHEGRRMAETATAKRTAGDRLKERPNMRID